ncbi:unnamed protein product [Rotaria socialis]|uniref:Uncharacterized protein n=1 Tax=Rotaria socialis TaxID=392032 RepID=A0A817YZV8_9BILA|nr:unnamed protein product [Rotaria socialis]CAF3364261.1 unnamed protein product [Rotaria socialis]CAF3379199.1 unnamed protein product [Rotaria socialis]CAF3386404.1 unnamed protein product [Rotaria socialis]CAF3618390.1 unnamed protein product [Rotaria socialis]
MDYSSENFDDQPEKRSSLSRSLLRSKPLGTSTSDDQNTDDVSPSQKASNHSSHSIYDTPKELRSSGIQSEVKQANYTMEEKRISLRSQQIGDVQIQQQNDTADNNNRYLNAEQRTRVSSPVQHRTRRVATSKPRTIAIDINISIGYGSNITHHQATVRPSAVRSSSPIRNTTATIDNPHFVDIDFHIPGRTAQLSTDGIMSDRLSFTNQN